MAEKIQVKIETSKDPGRLNEHYEHITKHNEARAKNSRHEHQENIDQILSRVEKGSKNTQELKNHGKVEDSPDNQVNPQFVGKQLKDNTLKRSLRRIQKDLKPYQRPFSKIVHNGAIELVSEASSKTIARPNGLLFGGIASFLISLGVLWACRYYGYEYSYFIGLVSFPAGFAVGLIGEFILLPLRRR